MIQTQFRRFLPVVLFMCVTFLLTMGVLGQEEAAAAADAPEVHEKTLWETIKEGGFLLMVIWVAIVGTSIIMVTLIVQNMMTMRVDKLSPPPLVESLRQTIAAGNYQEAWEVANQNKNYLGNVLKAGLSRIGRGKEAVEDAVAEHGLREATLMRTRNSYLSVIGVVSPMIGLLGTVIGMIGAFAVLGASGIKNPQALSARIGEVLIATASGLFIAIPAFVAYYIFRNVSQKCIVEADDTVNNLLLDIPYEELSGVQIGENFHAGAGVSAPGGRRKVSMALTTNCPVCSGAVSPGVNPCPHCAATLDWAA